MQKPTSMMVLGILNICFAAVGLLAGLWGLVAPFLPMPGSEMLEDLYADSTYLMVVIGLGVVGLISKLVMALSGVGLVQGKAWGRSLGNLWAVFSILFGLSLAMVNAFYIQPKTMQAMDTWMQAQPGMNSQQAQQAQVMQTMEGIAVVMALVVGVLMATVYQVLFLILNNRKAVRDYLAAKAAGGALVDGRGMPAYGQAPAQDPTPPADSPW
ncbi:MAG: hypothetical protein AAGA29_05265 [Planctomycetota bacterium]